VIVIIIERQESRLVTEGCVAVYLWWRCAHGLTSLADLSRNRAVSEDGTAIVLGCCAFLGEICSSFNDFSDRRQFFGFGSQPLRTR